MSIAQIIKIMDKLAKFTYNMSFSVEKIEI